MTQTVDCIELMSIRGNCRKRVRGHISKRVKCKIATSGCQLSAGAGAGVGDGGLGVAGAGDDVRILEFAC